MSICQIHVASGPIVAALSFITIISYLQREVLFLQVILAGPAEISFFGQTLTLFISLVWFTWFTFLLNFEDFVLGLFLLGLAKGWDVLLELWFFDVGEDSDCVFCGLFFWRLRYLFDLVFLIIAIHSIFEATKVHLISSNQCAQLD